MSDFQIYYKMLKEYEQSWTNKTEFDMFRYKILKVDSLNTKSEIKVSNFKKFSSYIIRFFMSSKKRVFTFKIMGYKLLTRILPDDYRENKHRLPYATWANRS